MASEPELPRNTSTRFNTHHASPESRRVGESVSRNKFTCVPVTHTNAMLIHLELFAHESEPYWLVALVRVRKISDDALNATLGQFRCQPMVPMTFVRRSAAHTWD